MQYVLFKVGVHRLTCIVRATAYIVSIARSITTELTVRESSSNSFMVSRTSCKTAFVSDGVMADFP